MRPLPVKLNMVSYIKLKLPCNKLAFISCLLMTVVCTFTCRGMLQMALLMSCLLLGTWLGLSATVCHVHKRIQAAAASPSQHCG